MKRVIFAALVGLLSLAVPVDASSTLTFTGKATSSRSFVAYFSTVTSGGISVIADNYRVRSGTYYEIILKSPSGTYPVVYCDTEVIGIAPVSCTAPAAPSANYEVLFTAYGETTSVDLTVVVP